MFKIKIKRFFKIFLKFLLIIYVLGSLSFIGYYLYNNFFLEQGQTTEEDQKEEVMDLTEGKIYLNNTLIDKLYNYLPFSSSMYNLKETYYKDFDQNILKAKAFEFVEDADSTDDSKKSEFILSQTTLNAKIKMLYGDINIKNESFSYYVSNPLIDESITAIKCNYQKNKYYCSRTNTIGISEDEFKYIDYATKDENGSIHIYEKYIFFVENNDSYDLYKDFTKQEKITTISKDQRENMTTSDYLTKFKSIPTYEHIFNKNGNNYYLYETKLKEE
jgi:hypothetical protein